eukprot:1847789-Amphidinium_carterae.2
MISSKAVQVNSMAHGWPILQSRCLAWSRASEVNKWDKGPANESSLFQRDFVAKSTRWQGSGVLQPLTCMNRTGL